MPVIIVTKHGTPPNKLDALIFDVDGVLVDSMSYHADAWIQTFGEIGINITNQQIYDIEGSNHVGVIEKIFKHAARKPQPHHFEDLRIRKQELFLQIQKVKVFRGMDDCLSKLNDTYHLAVASGSNRKIVDKLINTFFPNTFDVIISGTDVTHGKPSPEPYLKVIEKLGVRKDRCIVIENAPLGVESAKNAGLYCVAVPTHVSPASLKKADVVFEDHEALKRYLYSLIA
ncbi:MAG: HAD family phosphatase [Methanosarcinaceae archaeon]|nr:HAD family phosphatase [Methanosarcinaceae archaeon]